MTYLLDSENLLMPWEGASDAALLTAARGGDESALRLLLLRHAPAVQALADQIGPRVYDDSWAAVVRRINGGEQLEVPFRIMWLSEICGTSLDARVSTGDAGWDAVWRAFASMTDAWQAVLWHFEVEGQRTQDIATMTGLGEFDTRRAIHSAKTFVRRAAARHLECGTERECVELAGFLREDSAGSLTVQQRHELREHGRHCDDCLGLIRVMFSLEVSLREVLAARVLDEHAPLYLRDRKAQAGERMRGAGVAPLELVRAAQRPMLAGVSVFAVAAAISAMTIQGPKGTAPSSTTARDSSSQYPVIQPGTTIAFTRLAASTTKPVPQAVRVASKVTPVITRPAPTHHVVTAPVTSTPTGSTPISTPSTPSTPAPSTGGTKPGGGSPDGGGSGGQVLGGVASVESGDDGSTTVTVAPELLGDTVKVTLPGGPVSGLVGSLGSLAGG